MRAPSPFIQRCLLSVIFVGAGIAHFIRPAPYIGIVPPALPHPALLVLVSGIAEVAGGAGIWPLATRRAAGIGLIALLIAVFPANIYMLAHAIAAGTRPAGLAVLWLRLPLQPLMSWWVWRATVRPQAARA